MNFEIKIQTEGKGGLNEKDQVKVSLFKLQKHYKISTNLNNQNKLHLKIESLHQILIKTPIQKYN